MAIAVSRRDPPVKAPESMTRLTLTFRDLVLDGKRSWRHCFTLAKFAADGGSVDMRRFHDAYHGLKLRERAKATPEFVADLAGVDPEDVIAEVSRIYYRLGEDTSNIIASASHAAVVKKSIAVAKTTDGHRDRKMLFEHSNFLPPKTGGGIHVNASANAENKSATIVSAPELTSMESDTLRYTRILKSESVKLIDAPSEAPKGVPALGARE